MKEDQKKEDRLEKMIIEWKKMSKKRQCCPSSDQPNRKRMRPDDDNDDLADLAIDEAIRNCEEEHQDTGTDKGQAEQPDQAEEQRQKGEETKRAEQMCSDQEQGRENLGQAELMCSDQGLPGDTHTARQSPTITGAVARYVCFPIGIKSVPILTRLNQGSGPEMDQAEQPNRAEQIAQGEGWTAQSGQKAGLTDQAEQHDPKLSRAELTRRTNSENNSCRWERIQTKLNWTKLNRQIQMKSRIRRI